MTLQIELRNIKLIVTEDEVYINQWNVQLENSDINIWPLLSDYVRKVIEVKWEDAQPEIPLTDEEQEIADVELRMEDKYDDLRNDKAFI